MHEPIYEELQRVASSGGYTTYSKIAPLAGLNMGNQPDRNRIADILDEISKHEHRLGRPLLSAVVILADENKPGHGFFTMAREVGRYDGGDELQFWLQELRRVHDAWAAADPAS